MDLPPRAKGVKYTILLMIVVGVLFAIPGILYVLEGGLLIALLPLSLAGVSMAAAWGLNQLKKIAWIAAFILGFVGTIIFTADWVNINIESYVGSAFCIILIIGLVRVGKYYL